MRRAVLFLMLTWLAPLPAQAPEWITRHEVLLAPGQSVDLDTGGIRSGSSKGAELRFERQALGPALVLVGPDAVSDSELGPVGGRSGAPVWEGTLETREGRVARYRARICDPYGSGTLALTWWVGPKGVTVFAPAPTNITAAWKDGGLVVSWSDPHARKFRVRVTGPGVDREFEVEGRTTTLGGLSHDSVYKIHVASCGEQGSLSLPVEASYRAGPQEIVRGTALLPDDWHRAHGGIDLESADWSPRSADVVLYLYGVHVPGGGVVKLGKGEQVFKSTLELPAEGYLPSHGRLDEDSVFAIRTKHGLYGKIWLDAPNRDVRDGIRCRISFIASGGRHLPVGPKRGSFHRDGDTIHLKWDVVPDADVYGVAIVGGSQTGRRVKQPEAAFRGLKPNRFYTFRIAALTKSGVSTEPLEIRAHTFPEGWTVGTFVLPANTRGSRRWSFDEAALSEQGELWIASSAGGASTLTFGSSGGIAREALPFGEFPKRLHDVDWQNLIRSNERIPGHDRFIVKTRRDGIASVRVLRRDYPRVELEYVYRPSGH